MATYNGVLSTQVQKLLTAQVDANRNVSNGLKDVILKGYGTDFGLTINGLIIKVGAGMVSCGGRLGYLINPTDQEILADNSNVRILAEIDLSASTFTVKTETSTTAFANPIQNDVINNTASGIYQVVLYSGTSANGALSLTRQTPTMARMLDFQNNTILDNRKLNKFENIKVKVSPGWNNNTNQINAGTTALLFGEKQYRISNNATNGNTLSILFTATDGIITASAIIEQKTGTEVIAMLNSSGTVDYSKNGIIETLKIPISWENGQLVRDNNYYLEYLNNTNYLMPTPDQGNLASNRVTYDKVAQTYTVNASLSYEFMGRRWWRAGKPTGARTFTGKNLIAVFYMQTSTFDLEANSNSLQTLAEDLRAAANRDAINWAIKIPIIIDGIWQFTQNDITLELNEGVYFCSIPNNAINTQKIQVLFSALNFNAQAAPNWFCRCNFKDNSKVDMLIEWERASQWMGDAGGTDFSAATTHTALLPLQPGNSGGTIDFTINSAKSGYSVVSTATDLQNNRRGRQEHVIGNVKTGTPRTFQIWNEYDGISTGITATFTVDLMNKLVLVGRSVL